MVLLGSALGFGRYIVQAGERCSVIAYGDEGAFTLIGAAIIGGMVLASFFTPLLLTRVSARSAMVGSSVVGGLLYLGDVPRRIREFRGRARVHLPHRADPRVFLVVQATMIADAVDDAERRPGCATTGSLLHASPSSPRS